MTSKAAHAQRLWELSQARAEELGKTLQDVAADAGVSSQTVYQWRKGERRVSGRIDRVVSLALGWEPGSRAEILAGRDPQPVAAVAEAAQETSRGAYPDDSLESAIAALLAPLTTSQRRKVLRNVRGRLGEAEEPDEGRHSA
ncbi:helix-turn-helix transcriptional regulator [Streptomyces sp. DH37]|uniref:helix-turn-helix domain-containing protein n=1 Tax=Streptomyces sp. DH37 TaxID=3040122 RepID=UPI0024417FBB|nr:helix-turn-helix transcriptional regulator [Streptomyces sp. DH37]MDG9703730.1 helix-turn-helix transcriptional regulator [Streptomyces sp. DH37]